MEQNLTEKEDIQRRAQVFLGYDGGSVAFVQIKEESLALSRDIDRLSMPLITQNSPENQSCLKDLYELNRQVRDKTDQLFEAMFDGEIALSNYVCPTGERGEVESHANYQGDATLLFLKRINDPTIRKQLVRLLYLSKKYDLYEKTSPTENEVANDLNNALLAVSTDTPITFSGEMSSGSMGDGVRENMDVKWKPTCGVLGEYGVKQKNYTEAHEKGHTVRKLRSTVARVYINTGFDFNNVRLSKDRLNSLRAHYAALGEDVSAATDEELRDSVIEYLENPMELIERMSQLKNYFGILGTEPFTKEHLVYARDRYIPDTGMDNHMVEFLQAITPQTEDKFLAIINNCGV